VVLEHDVQGVRLVAVPVHMDGRAGVRGDVERQPRGRHQHLGQERDLGVVETARHDHDAVGLLIGQVLRVDGGRDHDPEFAILDAQRLQRALRLAGGQHLRRQRLEGRRALGAQRRQRAVGRFLQRRERAAAVVEHQDLRDPQVAHVVDPEVRGHEIGLAARDEFHGIVPERVVLRGGAQGLDLLVENAPGALAFAQGGRRLQPGKRIAHDVACTQHGRARTQGQCGQYQGPGLVLQLHVTGLSAGADGDEAPDGRVAPGSARRRELLHRNPGAFATGLRQVRGISGDPPASAAAAPAAGRWIRARP
jgi:hypothetical protein